jgi:hypothetical protein
MYPTLAFLIRAAVPLLATVWVTGCVPWTRERPAYADLCESGFEFHVSSSGIDKTIVLHAYLYDHAAQWSDEPFQQLYSVSYPGEKYPQPEFYVQLIAYEKSARRFFNSGRYKPTLPIVFDSRKAYVTFEDGTRLVARSEIHLGALTYDYPVEGAQYSRESPYDINSTEVHGRIPKVTNDKRHGSVYVIFKTSAFTADSKWTIQLGTLEVAGQSLEIPKLELCYHPVKKWIGIEPLMRP